MTSIGRLNATEHGRRGLALKGATKYSIYSRDLVLKPGDTHYAKS